MKQVYSQHLHAMLCIKESSKLNMDCTTYTDAALVPQVMLTSIAEKGPLPHVSQ